MVSSLSPSNAVRTRFSPAAMGDDMPAGTGTFHFRFFSGPNSVGGFWPSATPDPFGPRNRGQTSDSSVAAPEFKMLSTTRQNRIFIVISFQFKGTNSKPK